MSELIYQSIHTGAKIDEAVSKVPTLEERINTLASKVIAESGSNENGNYVKFEDGTMICYNAVAGSDIGTSWVVDWTFPAVFSQLPRVTHSLGINTSDATVITDFRGGCRIPSTTVVKVAYRKVGTLYSTQSVNLGLLAIGRWK